jgi:hypothetical protein
MDSSQVSEATLPRAPGGRGGGGGSYGRAVSPKATDRDLSTEAFNRGMERTGNLGMMKGVTSMSESYQKFELDTQEEKELEKMALKLEQDKRRFELLTDMRKKKKQAAMHARANELSKKLSELEKEESTERFKRVELRGRLQKLREEEKQKEDREREMNRQLWELERDHQIEEIAQLKMKVAAIRHKRETVTLQLDIADTHVHTIEEERIERGRSNYDRLKDMLQHADTLQQQLDSGSFDDEKKAAAATQLLDQVNTGKPQGDGGSLFKLSDEVENMRKQRREREAGIRASKLKALNEKRKELHDRQQQLAKERREFRLLRSKGVDVLADIEFGRGPPLEFILANANARNKEAGEGPSDTDSEEDPLDQFVEETKENIKKIKDVMAEIQAELPLIPELKRFAEGPYDRMRPYGGEMGKKSYLKSQIPAYNICLSVCNDIVEEVIFYLFVFRQTREGAERAIKQHAASVRQRERKEDTGREDRAVRFILNGIFEDEVVDIASSIALEYDTCRSKASQLGRKLILNSFPEDLQAQLKTLDNVFGEMIKRRDKLDETSTSRRAHLRTTLNMDTHHTKTPTQLTAAEVSSDDKKSEADKEEEKAEVDPDVVFIPTVSRTLKGPKLPAEYVTMEKVYWERVTFTWEILDLSMHAKKTGGIACVSVSPDGRFVLTGHEKGSLLLFDTFWNPPLLIRASFRDAVAKAKQSPVAQIRWGNGGSGHRIATIDEANVVRIWSTETIVSQARHSAIKNFFPENMADVAKKPQGLSLIAYFSPDDSGRASNTLNDPSLQPTSLCFHPSITVSGQQPSLMIGMGKGLIVKHNLNSDSRVLFEKPYADAEPANPLVKGKSKDPESVAAKLKLADTGNQTRPKVTREFFQAHTGKIVYMDFVGCASSEDDPTTKLVSVDETGHVFMWPYTADGFSGFGWFVPSGKYKIRDHTTSATELTTLRIKRAVCNRARTQLILLCHASQYPIGSQDRRKKPGDLRILFWDLQASQVLPWAITVATEIGPDQEVGMQVSPLLDAVATDVVYITVNNTFYVYSLATGQPLRDPEQPFKFSKNTMLGTLMDCDPGNSTLFVTAKGEVKVFMGRIKDTNSTVGRRDKFMVVKRMIMNEGVDRSTRVRLFSTGPEHRVRNIYWDISEHNVDRECAGMVYEMAREAADIALKKEEEKRAEAEHRERTKNEVTV